MNTTPLNGLELPAEHIAEYDAAAEWCVTHGFWGREGDKLPPLMSTEGALKYIQDDPEAFQERIRLIWYEKAMESHGMTEKPTKIAVKLAEAARERGNDDASYEWKLKNCEIFARILKDL